MAVTAVSKNNVPLLVSAQFEDTKDPCPVFDGQRWHIYGSGGSIRTEKWKIFHATADALEGPWCEEYPAILVGVEGDHVAAPGVYFDDLDGTYHMFVQTDFLATGGGVEYLISHDGHTFHRTETALASLAGTGECGIYDPHPSVIHGKKYLVYSGTPRVQKTESFFVSQPDIYLAESASGEWAGPWNRLGKILDHDDIAEHHNHRDHGEYEWGIEGPQLVELPNGGVLLNATCFLPEGKYGERQRVFFAVSRDVRGPYKTLGPVLQGDNEWESGENGHAAARVHDDKLVLFYQARAAKEPDVLSNKWRYGIAEFDIEPLLAM